MLRPAGRLLCWPARTPHALMLHKVPPRDSCIGNLTEKQDSRASSLSSPQQGDQTEEQGSLTLTAPPHHTHTPPPYMS